MSDGAPLVLMYHRIDTGWADPGALRVSPEHFAEHLEVLRREARPLELSRLVGGLRAGRVPKRSVVVTFDDGYMDNLVKAKPLLDRYDVPATIFVAGGREDLGSEFWWDELERLLLQPNVLPERLELQLGESTLRADLGETAVYSEPACAAHRSWRAWDAPPTSRHALYVTLSRIIATMRGEDQRAVMARLREWAGSTTGLGAQRLSTTELAILAQDQLVTVGAHSVTHPMLSRLPLDRQRDEIEGSRRHLEEALNFRVREFAYPHGDYSRATQDIVRDAGFTSACATNSGPVHPAADLFALPRLHVYDLAGEEFARWLYRVWGET